MRGTVRRHCPSGTSLEAKDHKKETTSHAKGRRRKAIIRAAVNELESKNKATDRSEWIFSGKKINEIKKSPATLITRKEKAKPDRLRGNGPLKH